MLSPSDNKIHHHAFLIMAHNNWYTLERLIQIIDTPWSDIYLHIDSKAKDFCKKKFLNLPQYSSIYFTRRHNVTWGNESQVIAEMELFKTSLKNGPYHYYHFLSGSDLPLMNAADIYDFFENKEWNYLHVESDVAPFEWRLKNYINVFRSKWLPVFVRKQLNALSEICQYKMKTNRLHWLKSHYPVLGKGHNWCDLTQKAVEALVNAENDIRKFTRFTHCSDEMYKQIILLNQPKEKIGLLSDIDIRYIDWSANGNHPRTLTMRDYDLLTGAAASQCVFARKFDDKVDREIIDKLYNQLRKTKDGR